MRKKKTKAAAALEGEEQCSTAKTHVFRLPGIHFELNQLLFLMQVRSKEEPGRARGSQGEGGVRRSQEEPGGARGTQEELVRARRSQRSQEESGGARRSQEDPGVRRSQEEPGGA